MKSITFCFIALIASHALAKSSISIPLANKETFEIEWNKTDVNETNIEYVRDLGGQDAVFNGNICFKGLRREVIDVLSFLDEIDFLGDEYRIQNIFYVGPDKISYKIYDGPNDTIANELVIKRCQ